MKPPKYIYINVARVEFGCCGCVTPFLNSLNIHNLISPLLLSVSHVMSDIHWNKKLKNLNSKTSKINRNCNMYCVGRMCPTQTIDPSAAGKLANTQTFSLRATRHLSRFKWVT